MALKWIEFRSLIAVGSRQAEVVIYTFDNDFQLISTSTAKPNIYDKSRVFFACIHLEHSRTAFCTKKIVAVWDFETQVCNDCVYWVEPFCPALILGSYTCKPTVVQFDISGKRLACSFPLWKSVIYEISDKKRQAYN